MIEKILFSIRCDRTQNDWAIAETWDMFVIKISENNNDYPEIGLPEGTYFIIIELGDRSKPIRTSVYLNR